jgi:hypothetical protein
MSSPTSVKSSFHVLHDVKAQLSTQEKFSSSMVFPTLFAKYFCDKIATQTEKRLGCWSRIYLVPMSLVLNALLLPFTLITSLISLVAIPIFAIMRGVVKDQLERESWNRSLHICTYAAFQATVAMGVGLITGAINPSYPLLDKFLNGIPSELKV